MNQYINVGPLSEEDKRKIWNMFPKKNSYWNFERFCKHYKEKLCWDIQNGVIDGYCSENFYIDLGYSKLEVKDLLKPLDELNEFCKTVHINIEVTVNGKLVDLPRETIIKLLGE